MSINNPIPTSIESEILLFASQQISQTNQPGEHPGTFNCEEEVTAIGRSITVTLTTASSSESMLPQSVALTWNSM